MKATMIEKPSPFDRLARLITSGLYTGKAPIAPGTAGSLLALVLFFIFAPFLDWPAYAAALACLAVAGTLLSSRVARLLDDPDPKEIVIDEICGFFIACFMVPREPMVIIACFFLFRLFDIVKPFPARWMESLPGGDGIMCDDIVAGLYTNLVVRVGAFFFLL